MRGQNLQISLKVLNSDCLFGFSDDFSTDVRNVRKINVKQRVDLL